MRRPLLAPLAYALVLGVMAAAQLSDIPGFYDALRTYDVPDPAARGLAVLAIVGEAAVAVGLLLGLARPRLGFGQVAGVLGVVVAGVWCALVAQALLRGLDVPNAGHLGVHLARELRWWVLALDVGGLLLAVAAWRQLTSSAARAAASAL